MTDADVDGSHIRTLLLTFFYRQMPQIIQNGHLFIAQPPLYRVKKGKTERYLKDESELQEYLVDLSLENILVKTGQKELSGTTLKDFVQQVLQYQQRLRYFATKTDARVLDALVLATSFQASDLANEAQLKTVIEVLALRLKASAMPVVIEAMEISDDAEHSCKRVALTTQVNGIKRVTMIDARLAHQSEFVLLQDLAGKILAQGAAPYDLTVKDQNHVFHHPVELKDAVIELGKGGVYIQRYKGLGEMNPEQLWETTMDPTQRTLLQVRVEDAVECDQIFTVLMGDQVEPRRDFIETNALSAKNLDI
jgi:DNA gyrase subunit B